MSCKHSYVNTSIDDLNKAKKGLGPNTDSAIDAYAYPTPIPLYSSSPLLHRPPTMPLEATMMIIDNSEFMRNGDYQPSRFEAQSDAVNTVFQTKIDSNPENTVGIMTMAGKG